MANLKEGRKISLEEAKRLCTEAVVDILWRPEPGLPEDRQYAIFFEEVVP